MMGGRSPRRKGVRAEREVANRLKEEGLAAQRVPLSGSAPGMSGDVRTTVGGRELVGEVKRRRQGFKELYRWLEGKDLLFMRADRSDWLVCMKLDLFLWLLRQVPWVEGGDGDGR